MSNTILPATSAPFHPGTPWELFRFETPEAAAPSAGPVSPADPAAAPSISGTPDPEAGAAPAEPSAAAPEAATPAWGPDSPEFQIAVDQAIAAQIARYQQPQYDDDPGAGIELDPWSDDFGQQLVGTFSDMLNQALEQRLGPIQQERVERLVADGTQQSLDTFATFEDLGEFDHDEAFGRAQEIFSAYAATYGSRYASQFTGRALREAAEQQAALERKIEERGVERYKAQLAAAAGRGDGEPGVGGSAVRPPSQEGESYDDVIARWDARQRAGAFQH